MKIICLLSSHAGTGQTTITVNLAAGLASKGFKILVCNLNSNVKIYDWLGITVNQSHLGSPPPAGHQIGENIYPSNLGIDVLYLGLHPEAAVLQSPEAISSLQRLDYDYLILSPGERKQDFMIAAHLADNVIACTDLRHENETCHLEKLQKEMERHSDGQRGINLILPNKINPNEWESNTNRLFAIGDFFGYEKIADLLPYCERIHDLPKDQKTVWQLRQQNLQDAYRSLLQRVQDL